MSRDYELEKHSVKICGHATSVTVEHIFWRYLKRIAHQKKRSLQSIIEEVDALQPPNLSSALRIYVLKEVESRSHLHLFASFHED